MKVRFLTLGCKVNQYETEAMLEALERRGFSPAGEGEPADVVVLNSCTVTAQSDQKARQALRRMKRQDPGAVAVLTGCWPQAFPGEAEKLLEADIVLGNARRGELADRILECLDTRQRIVDVTPHLPGEAFEAMSVGGLRGHTRAFIKIEDGCERYCAYCVIPYARGRVRSKPLDDLRAEVEGLARRGYREAVLTGINLSAYGQDLGLDLCDAVEAACGVEGISRVRLGSLEPERLTPEVIERLRAQEKLCPQFHLSLQSGCDATLKRMNRHYTGAEYMKIVEDLRAAFPDCAITTDVMTGFPGETEEEFAESLEFCQRAGFAKVHVFAYSRRPGTAADRAPDQVPGAEKERRSRVLSEAMEESRREFMGAMAGRTLEVLFEREVSPGVWEGLTANYTPVRAACPLDPGGELLPVKISGVREGYCLGELIEEI